MNQEMQAWSYSIDGVVLRNSIDGETSQVNSVKLDNSIDGVVLRNSIDGEASPVNSAKLEYSIDGVVNGNSIDGVDNDSLSTHIF